MRVKLTGETEDKFGARITPAHAGKTEEEDSKD